MMLSTFCLLTASTYAHSQSHDSVTDAVEAAKKSPRNQNLNRAAGDALKGAGRYAESIPYYMKGGNAGNLGAAESAYYMYDFENARAYLDKYLEKRTEAETKRDENYSYGLNTETIDWTDYLSDRIDIGRSMLDRVEKIQIIDSINVPADNFFEFVRIARTAGTFLGEDIAGHIITDYELDKLGMTDISSPVYLTENADEMIWSGVDADGGMMMFESSRLADDSWDTPRKLFDYTSIFGSDNGSIVSYPFLMADGTTLYFAADGEESLGNLDIFISRRDENGFLQPSNIGMPYNSPYNDFLYAIDEQNGVGWWVTDRNCIMDSVTVYMFLPQELRNNYPTDTPGLADYAKVTSIQDTWFQGTDYADVKKRVDKSAQSRNIAPTKEFDFAMPDGRVLHRLSDFRNAMARNAMRDYLEETEYIEKARLALEDMRRNYANGDKTLANEILGAEKSIEASMENLRVLSNHVVTSEM